ncbi:MAG: N-ATPase subunit AtpR [Isosphaeraceae bacterium]
MNWIVGVAAGAGLGLVYFGGLWLTVRAVLDRPARARWLPLLGAGRLALLSAGLVALIVQGPRGIVAALGGLWLSRWLLLRELGGAGHGK